MKNAHFGNHKDIIYVFLFIPSLLLVAAYFLMKTSRAGTPLTTLRTLYESSDAYNPTHFSLVHPGYDMNVCLLIDHPFNRGSESCILQRMTAVP